MIVAHLFVRKGHKDSCLMCETTATEGMEAPYPEPKKLFDVEDAGADLDVGKLEELAKAHILADRPDLEFVEPARGERTDARPCTSDLIFRKKKSFIQKIWSK